MDLENTLQFDSLLVNRDNVVAPPVWENLSTSGRRVLKDFSEAMTESENAHLTNAVTKLSYFGSAVNQQYPNDIDVRVDTKIETFHDAIDAETTGDENLFRPRFDVYMARKEAGPNRPTRRYSLEHNDTEDSPAIDLNVHYEPRIPSTVSHYR